MLFKINSKELLYKLIALGVVSTLTACNPNDSQVNSTIKIDGSSTVYPITSAIAEKFTASRDKPVDISVKFSGTTEGFRQFCEGKTEISNASRPISESEMAACNRSKIRYIELPVAFDALTVVVNKNNN